jgi:hypothetical protein
VSSGEEGLRDKTPIRELLEEELEDYMDTPSAPTRGAKRSEGPRRSSILRTPLPSGEEAKITMLMSAIVSRPSLKQEYFDGSMAKFDDFDLNIKSQLYSQQLSYLLEYDEKPSELTDEESELWDKGNESLFWMMYHATKGDARETIKVFAHSPYDGLGAYRTLKEQCTEQGSTGVVRLYTNMWTLKMKAGSDPRIHTALLDRSFSESRSSSR